MAASTTKKPRRDLGGPAGHEHSNPEKENEMSTPTIPQTPVAPQSDAADATPEPCFWESSGVQRPAWAMGSGQVDTHPVDRVWYSDWDDRLLCSLYHATVPHYEASETIDGNAREIVILPELLTSVEQGSREVAPRVVVEPEHRHDDLHRLELTRDEAEQLGRALLTAVDIIDGHCNPGGAE